MQEEVYKEAVSLSAGVPGMDGRKMDGIVGKDRKRSNVCSNHGMRRATEVKGETSNSLNTAITSL